MQRIHFGRSASVAASLAVFCVASAGAGLQLRCEVTYAGVTRTLVARPVADPYSVASEDILGRFRFRAVLVGTSERIDHISLYAYQNRSGQAVLLQQANYRPPFAWPADGEPLPLTGVQHLYAGPLERELIYQCSLFPEQP